MSSKKKSVKAEKLVADTSAQLQKLAKKAQKEAEKYVESARKLVEKAEASYKDVLAKLSQVIKSGDIDAQKLLKDAQTHAEAALEAAKKDYEKARDFALKIKGKNEGLKVDERRVSLKVYYELNEYLFDVTVINFKKFLKLTNNIEDNYRIQNQNCINFAKTLSKIKNEEIRYGETTKYPMAFLNDLESKIKNEPMVSDRFWLLEKLEELKTAQTLKNNRSK